MEKQQSKSQLNMKDSGEYEFKISSLELNIKQLENKRIQVEQNVKKYQAELYSVYTSRSWRYTALLRKMWRLLCQIFSVFYRSFLRKLIKSLYLLLPVQVRNSNFIENLKNYIKDNEI